MLRLLDGTTELFNLASNGDVTANSFIKSGGTSSQFLMADGSVSTLTNPITGTGTTNYLSKFTGSGTLGNSLIYDNGTYVGIGTTAPSEKLQVLGNIRLTNNNLATANTLSSEINNYNGSTNQFKSSSIKFLTGTYVDQGHITFNTSISGVDQERVRIAETGNVGIGKTDPTQRLDVNGLINSTNGISVGGSGVSVVWTGTQAAYDAIGTKSSTTIYFIQ